MKSCEFINDDDITTTKSSTAKLWSYLIPICNEATWIPLLHKSPVNQLFVLQLVYANNEENIAILHNWSFVMENPPITGGFPPQRASNTPYQVSAKAAQYIRALSGLCISYDGSEWRNAADGHPGFFFTDRD